MRNALSHTSVPAALYLNADAVRSFAGQLCDDPTIALWDPGRAYSFSEDAASHSLSDT